MATSFVDLNKATLVARRVMDGTEAQEAILHELHDIGGHRGREGTYRRVADRYFWEGMYRDGGEVRQDL